MDDLVLMEVFEGGYDLGQIVLGLHFSQSLPALNQLVEGVVGTDLQQNVHILVILEHVLELHHVRIVQRLMDLYLGDKLSYAGSTFCLARDRFSELLAMILAARTRRVSRLVTS